VALGGVVRRHGRRRRSGPRHPSGDLILQRETPAARAAAMPHRRALGDNAVDQLAENELGRALLRNDINAQQHTAGVEYERVWRRYMAVLDGPRRPSSGHPADDCGGCLGMVGTASCMCEVRKREWMAANRALRLSGWAALIVVQKIALHDQGVGHSGFDDLPVLRLGLDALATHFGLISRPELLLGKRSSKNPSAAP